MGRNTTGVKPEKNGFWKVDKLWKGRRLFRRGFLSHEEAEGWLVQQLGVQRGQVLHGIRPVMSFEQASCRYLEDHQNKTSLETDIYMLQSVLPYIKSLPLPAVHDMALKPFIRARLKAGRSHKTINLALGVVRRILNLAATRWRDEEGRPMLDSAPSLTLLPLKGHQRPPRPISWGEQRVLLPALSDHIAKMALFCLNTGARDDVICSLQWDWEIPVPELGISVFEVPDVHVKGRRFSRVLVCNAVSQSVIEAQRGKHRTHVFTWRGKPIARMSNTAWENGRKRAKLGDLHVHDLRHTVGMRLREAGVASGTISDVLWHATPSMTHHYSMAQIVELHRALKLVENPAEGWNKSLSTLRDEARMRAGIHAKLTQEAKKVA